MVNLAAKIPRTPCAPRPPEGDRRPDCCALHHVGAAALAASVCSGGRRQPGTRRRSGALRSRAASGSAGWLAARSSLEGSRQRGHQSSVRVEAGPCSHTPCRPRPESRARRSPTAVARHPGSCGACNRMGSMVTPLGRYRSRRPHRGDVRGGRTRRCPGAGRAVQLPALGGGRIARADMGGPGCDRGRLDSREARRRGAVRRSGDCHRTGCRLRH